MKSWLNTIFGRVYVISQSQTSYNEKTTIHFFKQNNIDYTTAEYTSDDEYNAVCIDILMKAKRNDYKAICICKDNLLAINKFEERLACACKCFPKQWKIINLGVMQQNWDKVNIKLMKLRNVYPLNSFSLGSFAIGLAASVYDILIKSGKPIDKGVLATIYERYKEQCSGLYPNLFIQQLKEQQSKLHTKFKWDETLYAVPSNNLYVNEKKHIYNLEPDFHCVRYIEQLNNRYNNATNIDDFANYVRGKRIALVGYLTNLEDVEDGQNIDNNYDIVVRVHTSWNHVPKFDKYIGSKTDIIYSSLHPAQSSSCEMDIDRMHEYGISFFVSTTRYDYLLKNHSDPVFKDASIMYAYGRFHLKNQNKIRFIQINDNFFDYYSELINTRITLGMLAFLHLLTFDVKQIYLKNLDMSFEGQLSDGTKIVVDGDTVITLDD